MTLWAAAPHVHRHLAGELLVAPVSPDLGAPVRLNPTAVLIWEQLGTPASVADIAVALDAPVPQSQCEADVAALLTELHSQGLVRRNPSSRGAPVGAASVGSSPRRSFSTAGHRELWKVLATVPPKGASETVVLDSFGPTGPLIEQIERVGSLGQLAHAVDLGHLESNDEDRALIQERWAANQMHCLRVEQMLLVALRRLDEAGVPHRLLKGVAVSHLDHPDPSWREFGDADVLVAEEAWDDAVRAIESDPLFRRMFGEVAHPFGEEKGSTLLTPDGLMLDLHKRLNIAGLGARPVDILFEQSESFRLGDREVAALVRPARLAHALLHWFASKPIRRGTMRDLVELADADPAEVARIAGDLQLTGVVKRAAELVGAELGVPDLATLAAGLEPSRFERVLAARWGEQSLHRNVLWRELSGVAATPGVRGRARYVSSRVFPSGNFRELRGVSWRTYAEVLTGRRVN